METYLRIENQQTNQQIIINGVPMDNTAQTYLAVCNNCNTVIYSDPPGTPYSIFMRHLDTMALNNQFGYCPLCGSHIHHSVTIDVVPDLVEAAPAPDPLTSDPQNINEGDFL